MLEGKKATNCCERCALPTFVVVIILSGYLIAILVLNPAVFQEGPGLLWFLNLIFEHFEVVMILWNYFKAIVTPPGFAQPDWTADMDEKEREELFQLERKRNGKARYCHKCQLYKPPRAHHSRAENRCVLRMDHYCVWVNNCIGLYNHKFFYLFLFYCSVAALHFYTLSIITIIQYALHIEQANIASFIVTLMFSIFMFPMGAMILLFCGWHTYLLVTNQTSVEYHANGTMSIKVSRLGKAIGKNLKFKNIYDIGWVNNIKGVLGKNPWLWFLPTQILEDGIHYKTLPLEEITQMRNQIEEAEKQKFEQFKYSDTNHNTSYYKNDFKV